MSETPALKLKVFHANDTPSLEQQFNEWSQSEHMVVIQDFRQNVSPTSSNTVYKPDIFLSIFYYEITEEMMAEQAMNQMGVEDDNTY